MPRDPEVSLLLWLLTSHAPVLSGGAHLFGTTARCLPPHTASTILDAQHTLGRNMDTTTLLIIILVIVLVGGGGFYGRGRWW